MAGFANNLFIIENSEATYDIQASSKKAIIFAPVIIMFLFAVFLFIPTTRQATLWMLDENHPVELLTFVFALTGGIFGLALARRARKQGEKTLVVNFYIFFSVALIFIAMEEVAWGQKFFEFDTPTAWRAINLQGETTLHNVMGLQGHSEILRLIFGLGGLVGVCLSFHLYFQKIGAPVILLSWFLIITFHAAVDVYNDFFPIEPRFDYYINRTSELVELLIAISGFLYVILNSKMLSTMLKVGHP
ncbi:MAG: hypothetical protein PHD43_22020 [Methylococcales bacterium]|nr:hypothetical protein [Methylococcales bacterium]